ncbi:NACHT and WD repeat domain-containing protein [Antrihabitans cavernicola]|uniref:NACHT and WD repeat domain-containing protein n=1 Tax=Antrihabitans cavernicola TaxID=2495913 RepID=UPI001BE4653F|nr:WD40 repeat domain-containing protein [Spelaeibacter cavernicola]
MVDPSRDAKGVFAEQFRQLYTAAGEPPLRRIADAAAARSASTGSRRGSTPSAQRISDWKAGTNVPASFEPLLPVLLELIDRTKARDDTVDTRLLEPHRWKRIWESASNGAAAVADEVPAVCPYLGLAAYGPDQADWFFGRTRATQSLVDLAKQSSVDGGIALLIGASGAGKSSLLAAGLIPALARADSSIPGSATWPVVSITPGTTPLATLAAAIPTLQIDSNDVDADAVRAQVRSWGKQQQVLIVVDQGEELFTACPDDAERDAFLAVLAAASENHGDGPPAVVVVGIRADFYARCLEYPELEDALQRRSLALGPMRIAELRDAIAMPAKAVGLKLERGLEDLIIADLCGIGGGQRRRAVYHPGALPLLSHVLAGTWQHRRGNKLTIAGYYAADGVAGSLSATADHVWADLDKPARQAARHILLGLVQIGEDSRDSRRTRNRNDLVGHHNDDPEAAERALEALTKSRLVTVDADSVTLAHEVIIDAWPPLRSWIDEDRAGNLLRQRLEKDADDWNTHSRDRDLLYTGTRLVSAKEWADERSPNALRQVVDEFLAESMQQRRARERRRRNLVGAVAAFALIAFVAAVVAAIAAVAADREGHAAESSRDDAVFRNVLTDSDKLQTEDPSLSAQLDLVAHNLRPDDDAVESRILASQDLALATPMPGHKGSVYTVAYSPNGKVLASASDDKTVRLWDVSDRAHPKQLGQPLTGHTSFLTSAAFSPDGKVLASASGDHTIRLWDVSDPAHAKPLGQPLTRGAGTVYVVAFSPDGRTLAAPNDDHSVALWNVSDPTRPTLLGKPLVGQQAPVRTLAFSPDGRSLATGSDDTTVQLWNMTDLANPVPWGPPLTGFTRAAHSVAFSPDSSKLAAGSDDTTAQLWNVSDPAHPVVLGRPLAAHSAALWTVAFSPDGHILATGSWDGTTKLWNLSDPATPTLEGPALAGGGGAVISVAFSPDGQTLAAGSQEGVVRLWSLSTTVKAGHSDQVKGLGLSADGSVMATASVDGTMQLWDSSDPTGPKRLGRYVLDGRHQVDGLAISPDARTVVVGGGADGKAFLLDTTDRRNVKPITMLQLATRYAYPFAFSPDGSVLVTGNDDNSIQLWDVRDRTKPIRIGAPIDADSGFINDAQFSPDGKILATAGSDDTVKLWDVSDRARVRQLGHELDGHTKAVNSIAFSPDQRTLASTGDDLTIRLWDITDPANGTAIGKPIVAHRSSIHSVAFSPDGRTIASGSDDTTVRLWDVSDRSNPSAIGTSITPPGTQRWLVQFNPAGGSLAGVGEGGAVRLWDLDVAHSIHRICATTATMMTPELWTEHLPQLPYKPPCA